MHLFTKSKNKIYSVIVSVLLVIQPLEANKNIKLNAKEDVNLTASTIESKGGSVNVNAGDEINLKAGENYQEYEYSRTSSSSSMGGLKKKTTTTNYHEQDLTHTGSVIKGRDGVDLTAQNNITVEGSTLGSRNGDINIQTQGDVTFKAVQDKKLVEQSSNTKKSFAGINYGKAGSSSTLNQTINQGSISEAMGNIDSKAGGITTLQASKLKASVGNVAFDYVGHSVYSNDSQFPQLRDAIPKTVIHSLIGGTLSELAGGDFSQGAINTAVSHTVADYMDKELFEKTVCLRRKHSYS